MRSTHCISETKHYRTYVLMNFSHVSCCRIISQNISTFLDLITWMNRVCDIDILFDSMISFGPQDILQLHKLSCWQIAYTIAFFFSSYWTLLHSNSSLLLSPSFLYLYLTSLISMPLKLNHVVYPTEGRKMIFCN